MRAPRRRDPDGPALGDCAGAWLRYHRGHDGPGDPCVARLLHDDRANRRDAGGTALRRFDDLAAACAWRLRLSEPRLRRAISAVRNARAWPLGIVAGARRL